MKTLGEYLVEMLSAYGIDTVFGIPGVHTVELYRGLASSPIRHVTPRHEQGAGFMADGYARVSGRPAAAFVITGPGLTNIVTAMAQVYGDSIPMLVISSVNQTSRLGMGQGDLHEVRRQGLIAAQAAAFSHTVLSAEQLPTILARAFAVFESDRPRPVHIEIPVDLLTADAGHLPVVRAPAAAQACPPPERLAQASKLLDAATRPLIIAGGGAKWASASLAALAQRCDAPLVQTTNARGILPLDHPLSVPASPTFDAVRTLIGEADLVLLVGTEIGRTDYNMYDRDEVEFGPKVLRIEIDAEQMHKGVTPYLPLLGGAAATIDGLLDLLGNDQIDRSGAARAAAARQAAWAELSQTMQTDVGFLDRIRDAVPTATIVGDSTQAIYAGNLYFQAAQPASWFNSATGYGTLGFGVPAAIGAALASDAPVICLTGDGGFQFCGPEMSVAMQEGAPVLFIVWNNSGYGEIKTFMIDNDITPVGVDLHTPDFVQWGKACGLKALNTATLADFDAALAAFAANPEPTLIEIDEAVIRG